MKKPILLLIGLFSILVLNAQQLTYPFNDLQPSEPGIYYTNKDVDPVNVLLIRDYLAWNCNGNLQFLLGLGANVTVIPTSAIATHDFSPYCLIVIEGELTSNAPVISSNVAKFEAYVGAGGTMEIHASTQGANVTLPGGVISNFSLVTTNLVANPGHPIAAGIPSPFIGSLASHNYFTNLLPGTIIITTTNTQQPTTIEYTYGNGMITATGCTYEAYYCWGGPIGDLNRNNLTYSVMNCNLPINPDTVPLSPWAIAIALVLILGATVLRYKRIL